MLNRKHYAVCYLRKLDISEVKRVLKQNGFVVKKEYSELKKEDGKILGSCIWDKILQDFVDCEVHVKNKSVILEIYY